MSAEEFEKIFGNIPFEDIKKIQEYIDKNYISKQRIKEKIEGLKIERQKIESSPYDKWDLYKVIGKIDILEELLEE